MTGVTAAVWQELESRVCAVEAKEAKLEREAKKREVMEGPRRLSSRVQVAEPLVIPSVAGPPGRIVQVAVTAV